MDDALEIVYRFDFPGGESKSFPLRLARRTLRLDAEPPAAPPAWAALSHHQCPGCGFSAQTTPYCPIALNLAPIVEQFREHVSHDEVTVTVTTEERICVKSTSLQLGLSSLTGIVMVSSGCPAMEKLKPMVRFHLPFATLEETTYRTLSMYLVGRYFRHRRGEAVDWSLAGMEGLYAEVGMVNAAFAERLREAAKKDASINALVRLFCLAEMVPFSAEELLDQLEETFGALLQGD